MVKNKEERSVLLEVPKQKETINTGFDSIKYAAIFAYVVCMAVVSWGVNGRSLQGIDDANIYFVYMNHVAEGHGFVYNVGGERVEGFTSLLWTLIGSVMFFISDHAEVLLLVLNILIISTTIYYLVQFIDKRCGNSRFSNYSLLFLGLLMVIPGYFDWTILTLMETGLWSVLLIGLTLFLMEMSFQPLSRQTSVLFNLFLVLLVICRPESMLWGVCFIGLRFLGNLTLLRYTLTKAFLSALVSSTIFLATLGALIGWRIYYFGFPFPNTYYAKVSPDFLTNFVDGLRYLNDCIQNNPPILVALLGTFYFFIAGRKWSLWQRYAYLFAAIAVCIITLTIPLMTGGDHFGYSRFLQPTLPIFYLIIVCLLYEMNISFSRTALVFILVGSSFLPVHSYYATILNWRNPIYFEWKIAEHGRLNSYQMNTFFSQLPELPVQGVIAAGGSALTYEGKTIDLLGLNNVKIAHAKKQKNKDALKNHASFSKDIFFELEPDVFWYSGWYKNNFMPTAQIKGNEKLDVMLFIKQVFLNIDEDRRFKDRYAVVLLKNKELKEAVKIVASRKFLESLDKEIFEYRDIPINYVNE